MGVVMVRVLFGVKENMTSGLRKSVQHAKETDGKNKMNKRFKKHFCNNWHIYLTIFLVVLALSLHNYEDNKKFHSACQDLGYDKMTDKNYNFESNNFGLECDDKIVSQNCYIKKECETWNKWGECVWHKKYTECKEPW